MPIVIGQLIQDAYTLAQIIDPEEENSGYYPALGLRVLNRIIDQWSGLQLYIPYFSNLVVNILPNVTDYIISQKIVEIMEGNTVNSSTVKATLQIADPKRHNTFTFPSFQSRPQYVYLQQNPDFTSTLIFSPNPDQNYTANLTCKQIINEFSLTDQLTTVPKFYEKPLLYQLAFDLSDIFKTSLSPRMEKEYMRLMQELKISTAQDLSVQNTNPYQTFRRFRPWGSYVG